MLTEIAHISGPALRWAAAKASNMDAYVENGLVLVRKAGVKDPRSPYINSMVYEPDLSWQQGGEIIAALQIEFARVGTNYWRATIRRAGLRMVTGFGHDHLTAAVRAYCALMHGNEMDVPENVMMATEAAV